MKAFFKKYQYIKYILLFFILYMILFLALENRTAETYINTETWIDSYIPFNEYFVIPYLLWFVYIALGFVFFIFIDKDGLNRTCFYLFTGMLICLILYFLFPNRQNLRVDLFPSHFCQYIVAFIYTIDSPTNVCPSIHVYNSVMMMITLLKSKRIQKYQSIKVINVGLSVSICLATMMIKQHAFVDVICALILCWIVYFIGKKKFRY